MYFHDLQHARSTTQTFQGFRGGVFAADLRDVERVSDFPHDVIREAKDVFLRTADPAERLQRHGPRYERSVRTLANIAILT